MNGIANRMKFVILSLIINFIYSSSESSETKTGSLSYDYTERDWPAICRAGLKQSPLDLDFSRAKSISHDTLKSLNKTGLNNVANIVACNYSLIEGIALNASSKLGLSLHHRGSLLVNIKGHTDKYNLEAVEFHYPSEHTLQGKTTDIEIYLIHIKEKNKTSSDHDNSTDHKSDGYLNIAIMYNSDYYADNNTILQKFDLDSRHKIEGLNLTSLVMSKKSYFFYPGSLTSPECTETVYWIVMNEVERMSRAQFYVLRNWIQNSYPKGNARASQYSNNRTIYYVNSAGEKLFKYFNSVLVFIIAIIALFF
jgi:carbonic anhydrase